MCVLETLLVNLGYGKAKRMERNEMLIGKLSLASCVINSSMSALILSLLIVQVGYGTDRGPEKIIIKRFMSKDDHQKAADLGDANSQYQLGRLYAFGHAVVQDYREAAALFQKAADQGHREALFELGVYYEEGCVVLRDHDMAVALFQKAFDQGHTPAPGLVGTSLLLTQMVAQNGCERAKNYLRAETEKRDKAKEEARRYRENEKPLDYDDYDDDCFGGW